MLDKRKIRLMIRMASYEKQGAEEDLKISSYYKKPSKVRGEHSLSWLLA